MKLPVFEAVCSMPQVVRTELRVRISALFTLLRDVTWERFGLFGLADFRGTAFACIDP
jgi:hypothetical protein